jgi:hypothetical protein
LFLSWLLLWLLLLPWMPLLLVALVVASVALKRGLAYVRDVIAAPPSIRLFVQAAPRLRVALG